MYDAAAFARPGIRCDSNQRQPSLHSTCRRSGDVVPVHSGETLGPGLLLASILRGIKMTQGAVAEVALRAAARTTPLLAAPRDTRFACLAPKHRSEIVENWCPNSPVPRCWALRNSLTVVASIYMHAADRDRINSCANTRFGNQSRPILHRYRTWRGTQRSRVCKAGRN